MMARLQAEESMQFATRVGIGTGSLKQMDAQAIQRHWKDQANPGGRAARVTPQDLSAMGIGYQVVESEATP